MDQALGPGIARLSRCMCRQPNKAGLRPQRQCLTGASQRPQQTTPRRVRHKAVRRRLSDGAREGLRQVNRRKLENSRCTSFLYSVGSGERTGTTGLEGPVDYTLVDVRANNSALQSNLCRGVICWREACSECPTRAVYRCSRLWKAERRSLYCRFRADVLPTEHQI